MGEGRALLVPPEDVRRALERRREEEASERRESAGGVRSRYVDPFFNSNQAPDGRDNGTNK